MQLSLKPETTQVLPDLVQVKNLLVNLFFVGDSSGWTLIDAGLPLSAAHIIGAAEAHFGPGTRPRAVVLTHGHFDHVGSLHALLEHWDVPLYAHPLELPYLTGASGYPPPDPSVGGGMMALTSPLLPKGPFDFSGRVQPLPLDSSVPTLEGWRWMHTPGHAPGHVSLWRGADRTLIAGDAFVTTAQESLVSALSGQPEAVRRPPAYFTPDWDAARLSVSTLAALRPELAVTGHGQPMRGERLREELERLAHDFDQGARPHGTRYSSQPARTDERGVMSLPPARSSVGLWALGAVAALWAIRSWR